MRPRQISDEILLDSVLAAFADDGQGSCVDFGVPAYVGEFVHVDVRPGAAARRPGG